MSVFKRIIAFIVLTAVIVFMVKMPPLADKFLGRNQYTEWLHKRAEPFQGIISVWHIAGFKPYSGSIGNWLKTGASRIEKKHFGVYFDVEAITPEEAEKRMAEGERPDAFSFPFGMLSGSELCMLGGEYDTDCAGGMDMSVLKAVPYAVSCSVVLYYPSKITPSELSEIITDNSDANADYKSTGNTVEKTTENAAENTAENTAEKAAENTFEAFKKGKADFCIADAREAGNLTRALHSGKAEYFEVLPMFRETEFIQYLGIAADCDKLKQPYIEELIRYAVNEKSQTALCSLGILPLNKNAVIQYDQSFLADAYALMEDYIKNLPNTFDKYSGSGI